MTNRRAVYWLLVHVAAIAIATDEADHADNEQPAEASTDDAASPVIISTEAAASKVVALTDADFEEKVAGGANGPWFVEFYAPWCGHCKSLAPKWEELAVKLDASGVIVAKVDATQERTVAAEYGVEGFPTIKLIADGKVYEYNAAREVDAMAEFATSSYITATAERLPKDKTVLDEILKEFQNYYQDALKVHGHMPSLLPLVLLSGFFGAILMYKLFLSGGPKLDIFVDVKVVRDEAGVGGFAMTPSTMIIEKINEDRTDLSEMHLGDKVLAVDGNRVRNANDYKTFAHGKPEFILSLGRSSKVAVAKDSHAKKD